MVVLVLGATGRSGLPLVNQLLQQGYTVRVFVRNLDKLGAFRDKVEVFQGDLERPDTLATAIAGVDAVLSVIGHVKGTKPRMQTTAIREIIKQMQAAQVKRLIVLTGAGVFAPGDTPTLIDNLMTTVLKVIAKSRIEDGISYVEEVTSSDLDWTVVRVPVLSNSAARGTYGVGMVGDKKLSFQIARADLASYLVGIIGDSTTFRQLPFVAWPKK